MLISKKDISTIQPPLLMQTSDSNWKLVLKAKTSTTFDIEILERESDEFVTRIITQKEPPFYVGEDIWELNYGATLMTLNHQSLNEHPAQQLWKDWLAYKQQLAI